MPLSQQYALGDKQFQTLITKGQGGSQCRSRSNMLSESNYESSCKIKFKSQCRSRSNMLSETFVKNKNKLM